MLQQEKQRSLYWDNMKGILIILTVFAHFLYQFYDIQAVSVLVNIIYLFHMPAFVFVSGYFGKSERSRSFDAIARLLFVYFIFNSIMWIFDDTGNSILQPMYSYWYLLALAAWRLTARFFEKTSKIVFIMLILSVMVGFFFHRQYFCIIQNN